MKNITRSIKNGIWYFVIICAGLDWYFYGTRLFGTDTWMWWVGFLLLPIFLFPIISRARQTLRM